jgi:hypothetical protein
MGNAILAEAVGGYSVHEDWGPLTISRGRGWSDVVGVPQGWGKSYRGKAGTKVWFHAPVPTTPVVSSSRVQLEDVFVFFDLSDGDCFMSNLDVWDGPVHLR